MGFFDSWDGASVISRKSSHKHHKSSSHKHHHKRSKSRSTSRHRHSKSNPNLADFFGMDSGHYNKHNASKGSFFNLGHNSSTRSFFGLGRSSSYYKRQPRSNFMQRMLKQLKRLLRDLVYYAKRHPMKVFMLVIMPLITGGALTALLARFGLRLPPGIERMLGIAAKTASGDSFGLMGEAVKMASGLGGSGSVSVDRGHNGHMQWERRSYQDDGWGDGLMKGVTKMFW
ncbi:hypothetical protein JX265_006293 [Neoarthrinium moseri]|uniref:Uncharacterized protein n=1 Tax=Neoarthrinium moseri TaxID=1658444 RepID=A0A9Q0ALZ6_9PEZI|nr:uncharacterized protein JN550_008316 [Neoarthrinium moseri]KAI1852244.1 hypothetical protein JX266_002422 [Neoarthrinium moseri]KAI1865559.1 hypothetical protein JN550_008316 [Neoarthrinium moseri]KAI1870123.1 hypothetical protein JX265_006293 [Neoarthrinium moseri]